MKWKIDMGDACSKVALACCECGWRSLATSRDAALNRLISHERNQHPGHRHVRDAAQKAQARHAAKT